MKRIWGHVASVLVAALAISAAVPACADNDRTIFISRVLAPSANRVGGSCIYTDDQSQAALAQATLDVGLNDSYFGFLLVGNQLVGRGDPQNNRAESSRVHVNGAVIEVRDTAGNLLREFTSYSSSFIDPQANNVPDYAPVGLTLFDAPTKAIVIGELQTRAARKSLLINVRVFGVTLGGKDVESGDFQFPMAVCNGCLVSFLDANDPAEKVQPNCKKAQTAAGGTTSVGPCILGQDIAVPCQLCVGSNPRCDPANP
jgi:hypothetical protein